MIQGRIETKPVEQLMELRKARDRYTALADQLRDDVDHLPDPEERSKREQDARRIAQAYEKSIANLVASSSRMGHVRTDGSASDGSATKYVIFSILFVAACSVLLASGRPPIYRTVLIDAEAGAQSAGDAWLAATGPIKGWIARLAPQTRNPAAAIPRIAVSSSAPPIPQPALNPLLTGRAQTQMPAAIPEVRPRMRPADPVVAAVKDAGPARQSDGGFVAKVIQQDGTLKDEYFTVVPARK